MPVVNPPPDDDLDTVGVGPGPALPDVAAETPPASVDVTDNCDVDLPLGVWRALDRFQGEVMDDVRSNPPFDTLAPPQWLVLLRVVTAWTRGLPGPSQPELAASVCCSVRTVRRLVADLEEADVLRAVHRAGHVVAYRPGPVLKPLLVELGWWRDPAIWTRGVPRLNSASSTPDTHDTPSPPCPGSAAPRSRTTPDIHDTRTCAVSPMTAERGDTPDIHDTPPPSSTRAEAPRSRTTPVIRDTRDPAAPRSPTPLGASITGILEGIRVVPDAHATVATPPPPDDGRPRARALINKNKLTRSCSCSLEGGTPPASDSAASDPPAPPTPEPTAQTSAPPPPAPRRVLDDETLRAAACRALSARYRQGYPNAALPESFSADDVETVVRATARGLWTEAELDQVHLDAIAGSWPRSKNKPPTVSYIWGNPEFFERNVQEGRGLRETAEREARLKRPKKKVPEDPPVTLPETAVIAGRILECLGPAAPDDTKRALGRRFLPDPVT